MQSTVWKYTVQSKRFAKNNRNGMINILKYPFKSHKSNKHDIFYVPIKFTLKFFLTILFI